VTRGAIAGTERAAVQAGPGAAKAIASTADEAYRPLLTANAARAERLAAENAKRIAREEAKKAAQQGTERGKLELVRPEGGGAGTRATNKSAGGFGIGR
jgi:hypothetical protein